MKTLNKLILSCIALFGFYTANAQYNATISVTVNGMSPGDTVEVYADSLGGVFSFYNGMTGVTHPFNTNRIVISTYNDPQLYVVWMVDCKGDTIVDSVSVSAQRPQTAVTFNYCNSTPPPGNKYSTISGSVNVSSPVAGLAQNATVLLIKNDNGLLSAVDTNIITPRDSGYYSFTILDSGSTHMVKAFLNATDPDFANHLPTYATGALNWSNAFVVPAQNNQTFNKDINLIAGSNPGGPGFIGGFVFQGANKTAAEGDPIEGAQVMVMQNNSPVAFARSDANGKFEISNLAYGTYTVYTEIPGLSTVTADVTLSADRPKEEGVKVTVNSSGITTDVEVVQSINEMVSSAWTGFPNPVNDNLTLSFGASVENVTVTVFDITGTTVGTVEGSAVSELAVPMAELNAGTYFIQVETVDAAKAFKVTKH